MRGTTGSGQTEDSSPARGKKICHARDRAGKSEWPRGWAAMALRLHMTGTRDLTTAEWQDCATTHPGD